MLTPEETLRQAHLVMNALGGAISDDEDMVNTNMNALAECGWPALFGATLGFAEAVKKVAGVELDEGEFFGLLAFNTETGEPCDISDMDLPPEMVTAARIFTANANGDHRTAGDLFFAAVDQGIGNEVVSAALALASTYLAAEIERRETPST
ncbi:hypothetical protein AB0I81_40005 [Nonomuraea sp. NPDC050404]|uniref:hypothetical protein n=1 Tax=Nonomuraea sp. NPDC050404 TaxID=3155783 RepID=UPI0033CFD4BA